MNKKLNNKGFAITSFLYAILMVFLVIFSVLLMNMINSKLAINKIKESVKNEVEDNIVGIDSYASIVVEEKEVTILPNATYDLLDGVYLKRYDGEILNNSISYISTPTFDTSKLGTYYISYSAELEDKIYTNSRKVIVSPQTNPVIIPTIEYSSEGGKYNTNQTIYIKSSADNIKKLIVNVYKNEVLDTTKSKIITDNFSTSVDLSEDASWMIESYVIDTSETSSEHYKKTYIVDTTPPEITYNLPGGTYAETKTITINVSDATSGIKEFRINVYKNGTKDETRSTTTITDKTSHKINLGGDGTWRIETYAFDNVGNKNAGDPVTNAGWYYQTYIIETS